MRSSARSFITSAMVSPTWERSVKVLHLARRVAQSGDRLGGAPVSEDAVVGFVFDLHERCNRLQSAGYVRVLLWGPPCSSPVARGIIRARGRTRSRIFAMLRKEVAPQRGQPPALASARPDDHGRAGSGALALSRRDLALRSDSRGGRRWRVAGSTRRLYSGSTPASRPGFDGPMLLATALGHYLVILPLGRRDLRLLP